MHGVDLLEHQAAHLDHLVELTRSEAVDAVVVAGDVYDRAIPPVDAVSLLSDAVTRLAEHAHVVVTPGNHDSAVRLGFGDRLLRRASTCGHAWPTSVRPSSWARVPVRRAATPRRCSSTRSRTSTRTRPGTSSRTPRTRRTLPAPRGWAATR
nr:metallophosphoesterase [Cellulosimicrobium sp. MM]